MNGATGWTADAILARLRRYVLALLVIGLAGTATELLALAHYEDSWQLVPLVLIGLALVVVGWHLYDCSAARSPVRSPAAGSDGWDFGIRPIGFKAITASPRIRRV